MNRKSVKKFMSAVTSKSINNHRSINLPKIVRDKKNAQPKENF